MPRSRLPAAAFCAMASPLLSGCGGGAAAPARGVSSLATEDLSSAEGASAAVDHAERSIDQILGPTQSVTISQQAGAQPPLAERDGDHAFATPPAVTVPGSAAPPTAPAEPAPPPPAPSGNAHAKKGGPTFAHELANTGDSCGTACSALASMERATEHLCTLAGPADARCTSARSRVKNASARVHAACPVCG